MTTPLPATLVGAGVPTVMGGRPARRVPGLTFVDVDNVGGAHMATERLFTRGGRRIATIAGPPDMTAGADRLAGYRQSLKGKRPAGTGLLVHGDFTRESGERAMRELLERTPDVDGVFAANALMATGARTLRAAGHRVPDDVSVIGYDGI